MVNGKNSPVLYDSLRTGKKKAGERFAAATGLAILT